MNPIFLLLTTIAGVVSSTPVIVCQQFYNEQNFTPLRIAGFVSLLIFLYSIITGFLYFYIYNNIKMGVFYPIIKIIEIFIPIFISIYFYKETYNMFNYIGFVFAIIAIFLIAH